MAMQPEHVTEVAEGDGVVRIENGYWALHVDVTSWLNPAYLFDKTRQLPLADESYAYELTISPHGNDGFSGQSTPDGAATALVAQRVLFLSWSQADLPGGGKQVTFVGRFDFGLLGPTDIVIEHIFCLPDGAPWLEEQIRLVHRFGRDQHRVDHIRFGFRKTIFDRDTQTWLDGSDQRVLYPIPHRRRWGQVVDHFMDSYTMNDIVPGNWSGRQLPGRGAEAWAWTDGANGYVFAKYNHTQMEYGLVEGEFVLAPSKRASDYFQTFNPRIAGGANLCLRFGGVGRYNRSPEAAEIIGSGTAVDFGVTRIAPLAGGWQAAYQLYKAFLLEKGHGCPPDFDPPLHWNELYNLGWRGGDNAMLQEPPELYTEAAIAQDIGAEAFYFDPVWDIVEGSTIWDEDRLGALKTFVENMRDRYGLKTSLHLMMHTKSLREDPRIYRRRADGSIAIWGGLYQGGHISGASPTWQQMKIERLLRLAEAGVTFFMFDFVSYVRAGADLPTLPVEHPDGYYENADGQLVPLTMQAHAEGVLKVIQAVKQNYPQVLIEAHDRVSGGLQDFHPLYFQHGLPDSFDENWGFEYMWDPFMDLLSGKALSLYEYNLAYDIPLYLHIHCGQDNDKMLAFWWYASTCRHLGIGGVKNPDEPLYQALKQAVTTYRRLKPFFTRSRFVGVDTYIHGHVLPEQEAAVFVLFNLGSMSVTRTVDVAADELGISALRSAANAEVALSDGRLTFTAEVAPLSPLIVEVNTQI